MFTALPPRECLFGRFAPIAGWAGTDDGGELACGVAATAPPDPRHGHTDRKIGLYQEAGQAVSPNMSQVLHGRHPEALAEYPAQLRRGQVHQGGKVVESPGPFGTFGEESCCTLYGDLTRARIGCPVVLGLVEARLPSGFDAHRRRLPERVFVGRAGGDEPVVLNKSTQASTGKSFGSPAAITP